MRYRVNRTLLDDLEKVYYSTGCITTNNSWDYVCSECKNKLICDVTENLIKSIKKFY